MNAHVTVRVPSAAPARVEPAEASAIRAAVDAVLATGPYVGGPFVEEFEAAFADHVGTAHCVGVDNGSNALVIALQSLEPAAGGVVLVPPNDGGFAAAASQAAGLVPSVVDVDDATGLVTVEQVAAAWHEDVVAVVVTHLHGQLADIAPILAWCHERGARVVEDCAQAHGATRSGTRAGAFGDVAAFSFYPTKNLGAVGDGGALVTREDAVASRARRLRQYGWEPRFRVADPRGRNCRLDALQAAVLHARLPFLDRNNARRRAVVAAYRERLPHAVDVLGADDESFVAHHAVVRLQDRDGLLEHLRRRGIGVDVHYPYLVQEMPGIALATAAATPHAERRRRETLSLPCFPTLDDGEIRTVVDAIGEWGDARA